MSPQAGQLLIQEIAPRIRSSLSHCVSPVGPDDLGELVQDTIAIAAQLLHSVETRGKKVTAGNISEEQRIVCGPVLRKIDWAAGLPIL